MRVVSLVPSWTETLVDMGVEVVGRTRFCIHPEEKVKAIPIVGGTKNLKIDVLHSLSPDLVVFDKEENTLEMFDSCPFPKWSSHVTGIDSLKKDLLELAGILNKDALAELSELATKLSAKKMKPMDLPGVIQWVNPIPKNYVINEVHYLIWKNPWMEVTNNTYIDSVLKQFGVNLPIHEKNYPEVEWENFVKPNSLILLSSEPFPFAQHLEEFKNVDNPVALVDGECFSWFGTRSLNFLKENL